jgi:hypothetical protein
MSRRIIPGTFGVGMMLCSLLIATKLWASGPPNEVPDLRGHWDGFFLADDNGSVVGLVLSDITDQLHRRIAGEGLLGLQGQPPFESYDFQATVAADDQIAGTGSSTTGHVVVRGDLQTFAGVQGVAGIWNPDLAVVPPQGRPIPLSATLLHPFPDTNAPDLGGYVAQGPFRSQTDPTFSGTGVMTFGSLERGSFPGGFAFTPTNPNPQSPFSWPTRATTSADGKLIMIGQGKTGRMSYNGSIIMRGGSPSAIWGIARLSLGDGRILYNTWNATLTAR